VSDFKHETLLSFYVQTTETQQYCFKNHISAVSRTRSSATAEGPRDALC